jgi:hypothetical protein
MDFKNSVEYRFEEYNQYNTLGDDKYNYAKYGILNKCLPKVLFKGNTILTSFLQLIDVRLVMLFKQIDKVKRFKYITWY